MKIIVTISCLLLISACATTPTPTPTPTNYYQVYRGNCHQHWAVMYDKNSRPADEFHSAAEWLRMGCKLPLADTGK